MNTICHRLNDCKKKKHFSPLYSLKTIIQPPGEEIHYAGSTFEADPS